MASSLRVRFPRKILRSKHTRTYFHSEIQRTKKQTKIRIISRSLSMFLISMELSRKIHTSGIRVKPAIRIESKRFARASDRTTHKGIMEPVMTIGLPTKTRKTMIMIKYSTVIQSKNSSKSDKMEVKHTKIHKHKWKRRCCKSKRVCSVSNDEPVIMFIMFSHTGCDSFGYIHIYAKNKEKKTNYNKVRTQESTLPLSSKKYWKSDTSTPQLQENIDWEVSTKISPSIMK